MPARLHLLCNGTRGDVQPYLALGRRLCEAGYRVTLVAPEPFRPLVERQAIAFAPLDGNPSEVMMRPEYRGALTLERGWLRAIPSTWRFWRAARMEFARMLASATQACREAEALLVGLPTLWGYHLALGMGIPCLFAPLQPLSRTRYHASAVVPLPFSFGATYHRLTHRVFEQAVWWPWRAELNRWRTDQFGLRPLLAGPFDEIYARRVPFIYGYSARVAPRPADWPETHVVTGYWVVDGSTGWSPPPALERFLECGPAPVYVGFGSMGSYAPGETFNLIARAVALAGLRAIVPASGGLDRSIPTHLFPVTDIPHDWLFPRVAAVAHHGGAGTTGASLRAGVPTLAVPYAADQFFWGARLHALGAGPKPLPRNRLTPERLAQALAEMVNDAVMRSKAQALSAELKQEDGTGLAVDVIRRYVSV